MQVKVVTPDSSFFDGEADSCVLPAFDGEVGILAGHAPMIARMGHGVARVSVAGKTTRVAVYGGFVKVQDNVVLVLAGGAAAEDASDRATADKELAAVQGDFSKARESGADPAVLADFEEKIRRGRALVSLYSAS
ncbi:MAG: ATP synthase F1 subunit epsilon [Planctomycetes bacterium]|nr:ATP synthase F1 subunit epsilon [Planctomycetota bacterium]